MKRVLIIDDDETIMSNLEESFKENNIAVITCKDRAESHAAIINDIPFDAVILDWYFVLADDSAISKEILRTLNNKHFAPVFIYTGNIEDYRNTDKHEIEFPSNLLLEYNKTETDVMTLIAQVQRLFQTNFSLQISSVYRKNVAANLEKVLFELNELQNVDLARVLNKLYGNGSNVDWSNDIVLNLLHRSLISDSTFIGGIIEILQLASNVNAGASADDRKKIANKILYFRSTSDLIRNGDIVVIQRAADSLTVAYGIVITPDCDLEQNGSQYIDLVELVKFNDAKLALTTENKSRIKNYTHDSFYLFQSLFVDGILQDFIAVLKSRIVLREISEKYHVNYPKASKRLLFSQEFILNGERVRLNMLCTKVNPYKAEFLQKLHSSNSRVGIPDIKDLL